MHSKKSRNIANKTNHANDNNNFRMAEYPRRKYKNFIFNGPGWTTEKMEETIRIDREFQQSMKDENLQFNAARINAAANKKTK
jgi:hypothetical protein